jgi:shikimate kinase
VQSDSGLAIADIFRERGESGFRDLESQAVARVAQLNGHVVSLGGGAILRPANRQLLRASGKTVWLQADPSTIAARLSADETTAATRPSLTARSGLDEIRQVLGQRESIYAAMADWQIDTAENSPEQIAAQIVAWLRRQTPA